MIYPHPIRLGEPWDRSQIDGVVRHRRGFNCPTGLDGREQVWIVVEDLRHPTVFWCNGAALGEAPTGNGTIEFEITKILQPHSEIQIDVTAPPDQPLDTLLGPVRLEIRLGPQS